MHEISENYIVVELYNLKAEENWILEHTNKVFGQECKKQLGNIEKRHHNIDIFFHLIYNDRDYRYCMQ